MLAEIVSRAESEVTHQRSQIAATIAELEGLLADFKDSLSMSETRGPSAFRGLHDGNTAEQLVTLAHTLGVSAQSMSLCADVLSDASAETARPPITAEEIALLKSVFSPV